MILAVPPRIMTFAKQIFLYGTLLFSCLTADLAHAQRFGSNLKATPNAFWGCDLAPILDPISGVPRLAVTNQTTCTMRNAGYINSLRLGSFVPRNGYISEVRVRVGANPAPLRVVIMQCSPGLCGTAIRFSRVFRPRANKVTTLKTSLKVTRSLSVNGPQGIQNITDAVGLSAVGLGTLPLVDQGTAGTFTSGSALTQLWYPAMQRGDPRVEGAVTDDGLELLLQWKFQKNKP